MIAADQPRVRALLERLAPYARGVLERSGEYALSIHADEVGPEHVLIALMVDEECAAHRIALHAFADPETIAEEARALAAGILISGSSASLPFSAFGVRALRGARADAARRGSGAVEPEHLLLAAFEQLEADVRDALEDSGWSRAGLERTLPAGGASGARLVDEGALFRSFSDDAKRLLSASAKLARQAEHRSISAGHLLIACLSSTPALERAAGVPPSRARMLLRGRLEDTSAVEGGPLALDEACEDLLGRVRPQASTTDLLRAFHAGCAPQLAQILQRHKVTPALLERAEGVFLDP